VRSEEMKVKKEDGRRKLRYLKTGAQEPFSSVGWYVTGVELLAN
jgi:hypothetical protein